MPKIMKEFVIEEVSLADRPAQAHALATLRKSEQEQKTDMDDMHKKYEDRVDALKKQGMSGMDACEQARLEMPEVMKAENNRVTYLDAAPPVRVAKSAAIIKFEQRVAEIRNTEKCSYTKAMVEARKRYADEFAAYQAG